VRDHRRDRAAPAVHPQRMVSVAGDLEPIRIAAE